MLVECGFVRVQTGEGEAWSFTPALGRVAALGSPAEVVELYGALHGANAPQEAAYVLAGFCDQEDATPLVGWLDEMGWHDGLMLPAERIVIARHLMQHAICGRARPDAREPRDGGKFSTGFDASEFVALARVHLGMSAADAEALSMSELQRMLDIKFPRQEAGSGAARDVPSRDEYEAAIRHFDELAARRGAMQASGGTQ